MAMANDVAVRRVTSRTERRRFLLLPWHLYRGEPNWVPPLRRSLKATLSRRHPFFDHAEMELFLAERGREGVGRVAAILNWAYNDYTGERVAFFGFFESVDDPVVAQALFEAVRAFGRERGMAEIRGPTSPSMHAECGLLVEGFDSPPVVMMPYNPPFYGALFERSGLGTCKDLYAYRIRREDVEGEEATRVRLERLEAQVKRRFPALVIRPLDMRRYFEEVQALGHIFNEAREHNFGYAPMTERELARLARDLKPLARPEMCLAAELDGEVVGAAMALPDANLALRRINGRLFPFGAIRLVRALKTIRTMRVFGIAAKAEHRRKGVAGLLMLDLIRRCQAKGYVEAEASWVSEDNVMSNRTIMAAVGARLYKTYRIYSQTLSP
jgi:GNAT superfamily N-acetyltransferase